MVSVLTFYSDDPSSNPAEVYNFSVKLLLKRTKINKKEAGVGPFFLKKKGKNTVSECKNTKNVNYKGNCIMELMFENSN